MTNNEAQLILLLALVHSSTTRADYFRIEAEKSGFSLSVFLDELNDAYYKLDEIVNSSDYISSEIDESDGTKVWHKRKIPLQPITGGKLTFFLDNENIIDLLKPLRDFEDYVIEKEIRPTRSLIDIAVHSSDEQLPASFDEKKKIRSIIIGVIELPEIARIEFILAKQIQSNFSANVFFKLINDEIDFFHAEIAKEVASIKLKLQHESSLLIKYKNSLGSLNRIVILTEKKDSLNEQLNEINSLKSVIDLAQSHLIKANPDLKINGLSTVFSLSQLTSIFDQLTKLRFINECDRHNFIPLFQDKPLPDGWEKIKWIGSRKVCFSFMMDMCGDEIKAQTINTYFLQHRKDAKTGEINTKRLTSHDRTGCKRGFLDSLK